MGDKINEIIDRIEILEPTEDPTLSFASEDEGLLVSGLLADATLKNKILELQKLILEKEEGDLLRNNYYSDTTFFFSRIIKL